MKVVFRGYSKRKKRWFFSENILKVKDAAGNVKKARVGMEPVDPDSICVGTGFEDVRKYPIFQYDLVHVEDETLDRVTYLVDWDAGRGEWGLIPYEGYGVPDIPRILEGTISLGVAHSMAKIRILERLYERTH